jgi:hypothetical protein
MVSMPVKRCRTEEPYEGNLHVRVCGCSGRKGHNPAGGSPAMSIARFRHVAMPRFMMGNHMFIAWCISPGRLREMYSYGGCNLGGKQVWEPEHNGMTAASKTYASLKLHCGESSVCRTPPTEGEADTFWEATGMCTRGTPRGTGPSTYTRIMEITPGRANFQQGPTTTCKDRPQ